jgi:hypothetical protein
LLFFVVVAEGFLDFFADIFANQCVYPGAGDEATKF